MKNKRTSEYFENAYDVLAFLKFEKSWNMYYDEAIVSAKSCDLLGDIDITDEELIAEHVATLTEDEKCHFMSIFHRYDYFNQSMKLMA